MKKYVLLIYSMAAFSLLSFSLKTINGDCDAPLIGGGHSAAPGEPGCNGCHAGKPNTGAGRISIKIDSITDSTYIPGKTYTVHVAVSQSLFQKFGFQASVLRTKDDSTSGNFKLTETEDTRLTSEEKRNYITSTPCGADASDTIKKWSFLWQAPEKAEGNVKFYLAGLAANHNHKTSGDFSYTSTLELKSATTNIQEQLIREYKVAIYPIPANDVLNLGFSLVERSTISIKLIDLPGRTIYSEKGKLFPAGSHMVPINFSMLNLSPGTYIAEIMINTNIIRKKWLCD